MKKIALKKGDLVLLLLCVVTNIFGCLIIASATNATEAGPLRYLVIQIIASLAGVFAYVVFSSIDTEFFSEHRLILMFINMGLLLMLYPFVQKYFAQGVMIGSLKE